MVRTGDYGPSKGAVEQLSVADAQAMLDQYAEIEQLVNNGALTPSAALRIYHLGYSAALNGRRGKIRAAQGSRRGSKQSKIDERDCWDAAVLKCHQDLKRQQRKRGDTSLFFTRSIAEQLRGVYVNAKGKEETEKKITARRVKSSIIRLRAKGLLLIK